MNMLKSIESDVYIKGNLRIINEWIQRMHFKTFFVLG